MAHASLKKQLGFSLLWRRGSSLNKYAQNARHHQRKEELLQLILSLFERLVLLGALNEVPDLKVQTLSASLASSPPRTPNHRCGRLNLPSVPGYCRKHLSLVCLFQNDEDRKGTAE